MKEAILIIPDIRSAQNVGSLFRTSDAVGISKIYITGYSPTPIDKYGRKRNDVAKTALGAEDTVNWEYKKDTLALLDDLKKEGYKIVGLEQDKNSVDYKKFKTPKKFALVLGTETTGISKEILNKCDSIIEIPMKGEKESLNVAVSYGVAIFRILNI